ncbi:MAG: hypothetical protein JWL71_4829 [Acidobacteria bacterium]|nr:hypothetical protein [Acidobacteriota bacterium]
MLRGDHRVASSLRSPQWPHMRTSETWDTFDQMASDLDDLKTTVEELIENPDASAHQSTLRKLRQALDLARDAVDEVENAGQ